MWPRNPTPDYISREKHGWKGCMHLSVHCSFAIAQMWKHPKCPSADEWIKKTWRYISDITQPLEKNGIMPSAVTWMDLEMTVLNTKWSESDRERQIPWYRFYGESKKKKRYKWTYWQNRNRLTDLKNELTVTRKKWWSGEIIRGFGLTRTYLK